MHLHIRNKTTRSKKLPAPKSEAGRLIGGGIGDDDGVGRTEGGAAQAVVEVLGVAGGVVAERDGLPGGRGRGAADAPGLLREPPEQLPPRAVPAPPALRDARDGVARRELQPLDRRDGAAAAAAPAGRRRRPRGGGGRGCGRHTARQVDGAGRRGRVGGAHAHGVLLRRGGDRGYWGREEMVVVGLL
ncbi:hypothetical protein BRADI_2g49986v3 [Brachypodium distachyon]|uniref:Uncharacterized protein n=1 Tax=Brachypodium distachyon TaxID=15368 RepID=A0A2K2DEZ6_BRADI|nr:hypothetical protein BRADI_2g49986v3 [Brachypodium distachyon]